MLKDKNYNSNAEGKLKVKSERYKNLFTTFKYIYRTEGVVAFSKGILPRMSINVPATALSWGTYETIKSFLIDPKDLKDWLFRISKRNRNDNNDKLLKQVYSYQ